MGAPIAQLVGRPTEKPGTIRTRVRVPGAARDFFPQSQLSVQTLVRCPYSPRVQSLASTSVRTLKYQTLTTIALFGHTKKRHTHTGMGSAAPAAVAAYPGMATQISRKGQRTSSISSSSSSSSSSSCNISHLSAESSL